LASPPPEDYVVQYYLHNRDNYTEEKIEEIDALPLDSLFRVIGRIETSFEETRSLETRISGYVASIRSGKLPPKQERRKLNNLKRANVKLEKMRREA
jgi:hypothetical protein